MTDDFRYLVQLVEVRRIQNVYRVLYKVRCVTSSGTSMRLVTTLHLRFSDLVKICLRVRPL